MPCFMTAERAVRTTVSAMVSAALISAFLIISRVTGSVVCNMGLSSVRASLTVWQQGQIKVISRYVRWFAD